ncbi:hypothetical protein EEB14_40945 [Rhodococcus sp. WS4]|nr:hypothetical protein EEB14_40945 [Rhodococcus sp. WS4]
MSDPFDSGPLEPEAIPGRLDRVADITALLVRGRLDTASPLGNAWRLAQELLLCEFHVIGGRGPRRRWV